MNIRVSDLRVRDLTIYKSQTTLAKASTLKEGFRNRSLRYNSRVVKDRASDGCSGTFDSSP